jgi:altronate dehydratase large subunit
MSAETFHGYVRPDGTVGIRNHVVVIPTVACANGVADSIARALPGVTALVHGHGCGRALEIGMHQAALAGLGKNPNVAGAVVIGLGCETVNARLVASEIGSTGKPVECLMIQRGGLAQDRGQGHRHCREDAPGCLVHGQDTASGLGHRARPRVRRVRRLFRSDRQSRSGAGLRLARG